jgi:hypothetical protein
MRIDHMKPVVIVAGRRAEYNPDRNKLTIQFLFPKQNGGRGDSGEIILISGDVPQIVVKAPKAMLVEAERLEGGRKRSPILYDLFLCT